MISDQYLSLDIEDETRGLVGFACSGWEGFRLGALAPAIRLDGADLAVVRCEVDRESAEGLFAAQYFFSDDIVLGLHFEVIPETGIRIRSCLRNGDGKAKSLNSVALLETQRCGNDQTGWGPCHDDVVVMAQPDSYHGRVATPAALHKYARDAEDRNTGDDTPQEPVGVTSSLYWVAYARNAKRAFLAGFESSERWCGEVTMSVHPDGSLAGWKVGFDGGDVLIAAGEEMDFEDVLFCAGPDPWRLLETYADVAKERFKPGFPAMPPVSWCSWYAYRLGVTEDRVLENARIAAQRLKPLGLSIIEVDLGWEKSWLPASIEENDQFPRKLKWLAGELQEVGFEMGAWVAPFTLSEFNPLVEAHPEWLVQDEHGKPAAYGEWFWEPFGKFFLLDLTHPGAQEWLRGQMESLANRGVKYCKVDFISTVFHPMAKRRHDRRIVMGSGYEAARMGAEIIQASLPDALILNCGGPDMPGRGHWPLLYACSDTGNTGFLSWDFHRDNFHSFACHLFKGNRWGVLQPSCLCVGLPGTLEEARLRATVAFLAGGQIDISDTLTTLPEERWRVLTATLPPLGVTAKPVDLFDPLYGGDKSSVGKHEQDAFAGESDDNDNRGRKRTEEPPSEYSAGAVWHLHVTHEWDEWDLVGVFAFGGDGAPDTDRVSRFAIPFSMLRIPASETRWAYEFWGGQFLGSVPAGRTNPSGYTHLGDFQDLSVADEPGVLDVAFSGPGVKLLCLRAVRTHPWVVGTSFHQSCGTELKHVQWNEKTMCLSGELQRPEGESGWITFVSTGHSVLSAEVAGQPLAIRPSSNSTWTLPLAVQQAPTPWCVKFMEERLNEHARR